MGRYSLHDVGTYKCFWCLFWMSQSGFMNTESKSHLSNLWKKYNTFIVKYLDIKNYMKFQFITFYGWIRWFPILPDHRFFFIEFASIDPSNLENLFVCLLIVFFIVFFFALISWIFIWFCWIYVLLSSIAVCLAVTINVIYKIIYYIYIGQNILRCKYGTILNIVISFDLKY